MRIRRSHELGLEEARVRIDRVTVELERLYSLKSHWDGDHVVVRGDSVDGRIVIEHRFIEVHVELGLALMLFEGQIRSTIEIAMDEHFR